MTVVNPKSISGINSITTGSGSDNLLTIHTSDASNTERFRIDSTGTTKIVTGIVTTLTATTGIVTTLTSNTTTLNSTTTATGNINISGANITFGDSSGSTVNRLNFGAGTDLSIRHDGTDTIFTNSTGDLYINNAGTNSDDIILSAKDDVQIKVQDGEFAINCYGDGGVELFHNNSKKFETFAGGVKLGNITNQLFWPYDGNSNSRSWAWRGENGSYGIFELDHSDGADETLDKTSIRATANAGVDLYANNVKKLGTNATYGTILSNTTDDANFTNALLLTRRGYETSGYGVALQPKGGSVSSQNGLRVQISDGSTPTYNTKFTFDNDGLKFGTDTASANALDDYEEGTFTPTLIYQNTSGLTLATNSASGKYTKVGRVVWILGYINWSVSGSPINDNVGFGGLPFSTNTGQITAGSTRFIGNVTLLNTNAQSSIHQIQPYGTNGVALQTEAEQGNRSNELGSGNSFQARYQFWYHTE